MTRQSEFLNYLVKIILVLIMLSLSTLANFEGVIYPFAIAIAFACIGCGIKSYIVAPLYFCTSLINGLSETDLIISGFSACAMLIVGLFYLKESNIKLWVGCIGVVLCHFAYLYYNMFLNAQYLQSSITLGVSVLTYIVASNIFRAIKKRSLIFRLSLDESISLCFVILILACGLSNVTTEYLNIYHFLGVLFILVGAFVFGKNQTIIFSLIYGLGYSLTTLNIGYVALFSSVALAVVCFKSNYRVYSLFIALIVDVLFGMYFETNIAYNLFSIIESGVAGMLFMLIPNRVFEKISGYLNSNSKSLGVKSIVSRDKITMQKKLNELSSAFAEMDIVFRKMIKGVLPISEAKEMLARECQQKICNNCNNKAKCYHAKRDLQVLFYDLMTVGFEKGRVTILDVPANVTGFCPKVGQMLIVANQLLNQYKQYANMVTNLDSSRLLLAEQLNGVARIMKQLSIQIDEDIVFDSRKEIQIIDELSFNDIVCNDAIVYQKDNYTTNVNVLVRNEDANNPIIRVVVSKVCGNLLDVKDTMPSEISGWSMVYLGTIATYDIMFGYASICKNGEDVCGDNFSAIKLDDGKYMLAICDGMGSGVKAEKTSSLAISLVENFYKAGFDNDIILNSVNKLLSVKNEENFTALDLCVVDLKNCFADFIKLGAPAGFIKHRETTTRIDGGALPIGILDEMKPVYCKTVLNDQDLIVLCSDGVNEAFQSNENLQVFINNMQTLHPQQLADEILQKALSLCGGFASDDMTVLVGRVYQKYL